MTQPLALVLFERLLPGSQLVNRLQDLNYRVQTVSDPKQLVSSAEQHKPMLVIVDLESGRSDMCQAMSALHQNPPTAHLPIIAVAGDATADLQSTARASGATFLASEAALLSHLPQFLEQALRVD